MNELRIILGSYRFTLWERTLKDLGKITYYLDNGCVYITPIHLDTISRPDSLILCICLKD